MTTKPSRITDLKNPDAVKVLNDILGNLSTQLAQVSQAAQGTRISSGSTLQFGTIPANSSVNSLVNIPGASTTLVATANPILPLGSVHLIWSAYVSAKGQVIVKVCNPTTAPIAVNTVKWNILVH